jgi:hypothetical protein
LVLLFGCTHSDPFVTSVSTVGPFNTGTDVQLTLNPDQNYWPAWTQDGRAILYSFVDQEHALHRCLGLLAPLGGTRLWQLCDNRAVRDDSTNSFLAYALDSTGQLLVAEAVSPANSFVTSIPHSTTLWLADTARPYMRAALLTLPLGVGATNINSLADIVWTGSNTFIALGEEVLWTSDSVFAASDGVVLRGTIAGGRATLEPIAGTRGATGYSLAAAGTTIAFTVRHDLHLYTVPVAGGAPSPPVPQRDDTLSHQKGELLGVSCKGFTCLVAKGAVLLAGDYWVFTPSGWENQSEGGGINGTTMELHSVSLQSGIDQIVRSNNSGIVYVTPQISPISGDVVLQIGGGLGHLQTVGSAGTLHLYQGFGP